MFLCWRAFPALAAGKCTVHVMGWSEDAKSDYFLFNEIEKNRVCKLGTGFPQPVLMSDNGTTKPALLVGKEGTKLKIQLFRNRDNETWVEANQISYPFVQEADAPPKKRRQKQE